MISFCKDLTRKNQLIKIIIVDNFPQNFKLQKENEINIKQFWGEDTFYTTLIDLMPILVNFAKEGGDVKDGLNKFRYEIFKSNMWKRLN